MYSLDDLRRARQDADDNDQDFEYEQINVDLPKVTDDWDNRARSRQFQTDLPVRLSLPMFKCDDNIAKYIVGITPTLSTIYTRETYESALTMRRNIETLRSEGYIPAKCKINYETTGYMNIQSENYDVNMKPLSDAIHAVAMRCTNYDLKSAGLAHQHEIPVQTDQLPIVSTEIPAFLHVISHMRFAMARKHAGAEEVDTMFQRTSSELNTVSVRDFGWITYKLDLSDKPSFFIVRNGEFVIAYFSKSNSLYVMDSAHFSHQISVAEIEWNMATIARSPEYNWCRDLLLSLLSVRKLPGTYTNKVAFMSSFEALMLHTADITGGQHCSLIPIVDTIRATVGPASKISGLGGGTIESEEEHLFMWMQSREPYRGKCAILAKVCNACRFMDGIQLESASSLHKLYFYSDIDEIKGIKKFLSRVHTKRPVVARAVDEMVCLFRREFCHGFASRHKRSPTIISPVEKSLELESRVRAGKTGEILDLPLSWWSDIELGKMVDVADTGDPLEYAKEKSATKERVRFGHGDTDSELKLLAEMPVYTMPPIDYSQYSHPQDRAISFEFPEGAPKKALLPTKMSEKNNEQKEEGRLFASATVRYKHMNSKMMAKCMRVLSYFEGELMSISDNAKQSFQHQLGQYALKPMYYNVLLDIQGHNQSEQMENCGPLCAEISKVTGEPTFANYPKVFANLDLFYPSAKQMWSMRSKGQYGGIEGWANPLWTLHTLLVSKLAPLKLGLASPLQTVYSDDIDMVIKMEEETQVAFNDTIFKLRNHYMEHGFIVKLKQTAVTKSRATMLRKHYYMGRPADASLKRLMAVSVMSSAKFHNERADAEAVGSSIQSALELSNTVVTQTYMKWSRTAYLSMKEMYNIFADRKGDIGLPDDLNSPTISGLTSLLYADYGRLDAMSHESWISAVRNTVLENMSKMQYEVSLKGTTKSFQEVIGPTLAEDVKQSLYATYLREVAHKTGLQEAIMFYMMMPQRVGGLGMRLLITQGLAGHSDGYYKQMHYLIELIRHYSIHKGSLLTLIVNSMESTNGKIPDGTTSKIVDTAFPLKREIQSPSDVISSHIKQGLLKVCRNQRLRELLELDKYLADYKEMLIEILKDRFWYRISSFYLTNSKFSLIEKLITKVTESEQFLKILPADVVRSCRERVFRLNRTATRVLFMKAHQTVTPVTDLLDFHNRLIHIRNEICPDVAFIDIIEPLYDDKIFRTLGSGKLASVNNRRGDIIVDGTQQFIKNRGSARMSIKQDRSQREAIFESAEEKNMYELVRGTQFILLNSHKYLMDNDGDMSVESPLTSYYSNIEQACDLTLSMYTQLRYKELSSGILPPTGGEISHRLASRAFRPDSALKILPSVMVEAAGHLYQNEIDARSWEDSNINFDYMLSRLRLALAICKTVFLKVELQVKYDMMSSSEIMDVRMNFCTKSKLVDGKALINLQQYAEAHDETTNRIFRYVSSNEESVGDIDDSGTLPRQLILTEDGGTSAADWKTQVYNYNTRLMKQSMSLGYELSSKSDWEPFFLRRRHTVPEWQDKSWDEVWPIIHGELSLTTLESLKQAKSNRGMFADQDLVMELTRLFECGPEDLLRLAEYTARGFGAVVRTFKNKKSKSKLSEEDKKILNAIKVNGSIQDRLMLYWIINHGLSYRFMGKTPEVDVDLTISRTQLLFNTKALKEDKSAIVVLLTDTLDIPERVDTLMESISSLCAKVARQAEVLDLRSVLTYDEGSMFKITEAYVDTDIGEHPAVKQVTYAAEAIDSSISAEFKNYKMFMGWHAQQCDTYSDVGVFDSRTGAESYASIKAAFTELSVSGLLPKHWTVLDAMAGRGDGHRALEELGIEHVSLYRQETYTSQNLEPGMELSVDIDVTKPDTVSSWFMLNVAFFDVSYLDGPSKGLLDTIRTAANYSTSSEYGIRAVLVRINQLDELFPEDEFALWNSIYTVRVLWSVATGVKTKSFYLWIDFSRRPKMVLPKSNKMTDSPWFKKMARSSVMSKERGQLFEPGTAVGTNSVLDLIPEDITSEQIISDDKLALSGDSILNHVNVLSAQLSEAACVPLVYLGPERGEPTLLSLTVTKAVVQLGIDDFDYSIRSSGSKPLKRESVFVKAIKSWEKSEVGYPGCNLAELSLEQLGILGVSSPFYKVRRLANTCRRLLLKGREDVISAVRLADTDAVAAHAHLDVVRKSAPPPLNVRERSVRMALRILLYGRLKGGYRYAVELLMGLIYRGDLDRDVSRQVVSCLRKLSPLYSRLPVPTSRGFLTDSFFRSVETGMTRSTLRRPDTLPKQDDNRRKSYSESLFDAFRAGAEGTDMLSLLESMSEGISAEVRSAPVEWETLGIQGLEILSPSQLSDQLSDLGKIVAQTMSVVAENLTRDEIMGDSWEAAMLEDEEDMLDEMYARQLLEEED